MMQESLKANIGTELTCSICLELYVDPRMLDCVHTFCLKCLDKLLEPSNDDDVPDDDQSASTIRCPNCRVETVLSDPSIGASCLLKNYIVMQLAEMFRGRQQKCAECQDTLAEMLCRTCDLPFCCKCLNSTHSTRVFQSHESITLTDGITGREPVCSVHENEIIKFVCLEDDSLLCRDCLIIGEHRGHKCLPIKEARKSLRNSLNNTCHTLNGRITEIQEAFDDVEKLLPMVKTQHESIIKEMDASFGQLLMSLQQRQNNLKEKLNSITDDKLLKLNSQKFQLSAVMEKLKTLSSVGERLVTHEHDYEVIMMKKDLEIRMVEVLQQSKNISKTPCADDSFYVNFSNNDLLSYLEAFGSVQTLEERRLTHTAGVYVGGGYNDHDGVLASVEYLELGETKWRPVTPMTTARRSFCMVILDEALVVVGGSETVQNSPKVLASVEVYNKSTKKWESLAGLLEARVNACATVMNGLIYVMGGQDGNGKSLASVECYDPQSNKWTTSPPLLGPRFGAAAVTFNESIYVIGGCGKTPSKYLNSVEVYNISNKKWCCVDSLKQSRCYLSAVVAGGHHDISLESVMQMHISSPASNAAIYVVGGFSDTKYVKSIEKYDVKKNEWSIVAEVPFAQYCSSCVGIEDDILMVGGCNFKKGGLNMVTMYDGASGNFTEIVSMNVERHFCSCVFLESEIRKIPPK